MKKLIIGLLIILGLSSCEQATKENSIKDPDKFTTIEMVNLPKDTVVISYTDNNKLYVFEDGKVVLTATITNSNSTGSISVGKLVIGFICTILLTLAIGLILILE